MDIYQKINDLAWKYKDYTAQNLSKLVRIKSLSTQEEAVANELKRQLLEAGLHEVKIDSLGNVIGRLGNGDKVLAIDGHMDTVDLGRLDNWNHDPLSGKIENGFVNGRGTVDQKGGIASFVTVARILSEIGISKDVSVIFTGTVMEEDCEGLCWTYLVEEEGLKPDVVMSTEPTNLNIYRGHRGRMEISVSFYGVSAHGSAPERGKNAIYMAAEACKKIEGLNDHLIEDSFLGKGSVTVSEIVSESPSLCAVADFARIHLDRRLTRGETKISAIKEIEEITKGMEARVSVLPYLEKSFTGLEYGMEKYYPTWEIPESSKPVELGKEVFTKLFNKDADIGKWTFSTNGVVIMGVYGIPVLGFGPGDEVLAHAPNERVKVDDLVKAAAFYAGFAHEIGL